MGRKQNIIKRISQQGLLPLFYHDDIDISQSIIQALYDGGIRIIEYTNRGENALDNFRQLIKRRDKLWPGLLLGSGTIKNVKDAKAFIKRGTEFIISPGIVKEVGEEGNDAGILWIPGCMTTTEIMLAEECGAKLVKIFPGNLLGPGFVSAVKELFPGIDFMPTGGVEINKENLKAWFEAGVCAVGIGSKLISKPILENREYYTITTMTKQALEIIHEVRMG